MSSFLLDPPWHWHPGATYWRANRYVLDASAMEGREGMKTHGASDTKATNYGVFRALVCSGCSLLFLVRVFLLVVLAHWCCSPPFSRGASDIVSAQTHTYTHTRTHTHTYIHTHTHTHTPVGTLFHTRARTLVFSHTHSLAQTFVLAHTPGSLFAHTRIHTHAHSVSVCELKFRDRLYIGTVFVISLITTLL